MVCKAAAKPQTEMAHQRNIGVMNVLMGSGGWWQMCERRGRSALMLAAVRGHLEVVQVLLEAHATVDLVHSDGRTPLMYAAQAGCAEVVEALLAKGADPDRVGGRTNATALIYSVPGNHLEVVKVLVAAGAKVGVRDNTGKNALAYLKVDSSTQISNLLIEALQLQELPSGDSDR
jgi:ankyrin repeat protein